LVIGVLVIGVIVGRPLPLHLIEFTPKI